MRPTEEQTLSGNGHVVVRLEDDGSELLIGTSADATGLEPGGALPPGPWRLVLDYFDSGGRRRVYRAADHDDPHAALARELSAARTPRDCAHSLLEIASRLFAFDAAFMVLYPEDRRRAFSIISVDTMVGHRQEVKPAPNRTPVSPMGMRTMNEGAQLVLRSAEDLAAQARQQGVTPFGNQQRRSASLMYIPIRNAKTPFGIFSIQSYRFNAYDETHLRQLQELVDVAASALARTFSEFKLQQEEGLTRALTQLARLLGAIDSVREAGRLILETAEELFGWEAAFINLVSDDLESVIPVITYDTIRGVRQVIPPSAQASRPSAMAQTILRDGARLLLFDTMNQSEYEEMSSFGDEGRLSNSLMFAPIRSSGRVVGIVSIQSYQIGAYSMDDLDVFQAMADNVGAALTRIRAEEKLRKREEELHDLVKENQMLREQLTLRPLRNPQIFERIVTNSVRMRALFQQVESVAPSSQPVLVVGETGVGKELMARAIHDASGRAGPFIPLNVAGLDDELFSDALFGHRRGAYTNAMTERKGFVETAARGTLFLDEIGDLSLASQVKLLRLLQENEYYPIGADMPRKADCRIVVATNHDLGALIAAGQFRKDLYYRLQTHRIQIPPLRERREDIPLLLEHFVAEASEDLQRPVARIPREVPLMLIHYEFPGNVRELEALVHDAVSKVDSSTLPLSVFEERLFKLRSALGSEPEGEPLPAARRANQPVVFGEQLPPLREVGDLLVIEAMRRTSNNQSMAARLLGVTQQALSQRLQNLKKKVGGSEE